MQSKNYLYLMLFASSLNMIQINSGNGDSGKTILHVKKNFEFGDIEPITKYRNDRLLLKNQIETKIINGFAVTFKKSDPKIIYSITDVRAAIEKEAADQNAKKN